MKWLPEASGIIYIFTLYREIVFSNGSELTTALSKGLRKVREALGKFTILRRGKSYIRLRKII